MHGVYIGDNKILIKTIWGGKLIASTLDMSLMPDLVTYGVIESQLSKFLIENLKEGDTVVDIGANIGYYTILMGYKVGETGKVIAFEPNKETFSLLSDNVAINYLTKRVSLVNKVVYSEEKEISFYSTDRFTGNASIHQPDKEYYDYFLVDKGLHETKLQSVSLDEYFDDNDVIDYVKIDTEGGEYHCILGMKNLIINKKVKTIIFELNKLRSLEDSTKLYKLLTDFHLNYGVRFGIINKDGEIKHFPLEHIFQYEFIPSVVMQVY